MKKLFRSVALLCLGVTSIFTSVQAMHMSDALVKKTVFETLLQFFDGGRRAAAENRELFKSTCQKMGIDAHKIHFHLGKKFGSYARNVSLRKAVVLGLDDQYISLREREFVIAHELAHLKNNDSKERAVFTVKVVAGALGLGAVLERLGSRGITRLGPVNGYAGLVLLSGVCYYALPLISLKILYPRLQKQQEKRADLTAIVALRDKQGALDCFSRNCEENKKIRKNLISRGHVGYVCRHIDEQGNNLADKNHPLLTERLAYCKAASL